jgi:hypothetical protein
MILRCDQIQEVVLPILRWELSRTWRTPPCPKGMGSKDCTPQRFRKGSRE